MKKINLYPMEKIFQCMDKNGTPGYIFSFDDTAELFLKTSVHFYLKSKYKNDLIILVNRFLDKIFIGIPKDQRKGNATSFDTSTYDIIDGNLPSVIKKGIYKISTEDNGHCILVVVAYSGNLLVEVPEEVWEYINTDKYELKSDQIYNYLYGKIIAKDEIS